MATASTLPAKRVAVAAVLLAVLALAAWESGKRFLADASRAEVRYYVDRARAGTLKLDAARLDQLRAQLGRAIALDPGNPRIDFEMGNLMYFYPGNANLIDPAVRARYAEVRDHNARAAQLHPTYELAWGNLAHSRYMLGQIDGEFFSAMELALRYGPWNQDSQMNAIRVGIAAWTLLPPALQGQLRQAIHRQAHWRLAPQAAALRPLLAKSGRSDLLCLLEAAPRGCAP